MIHFISGLPRSGTTLLAALLNQNPMFRASVSSPIASLWNQLLTAMSPTNETYTKVNELERAAILRGVMEAYHFGAKVVFDNNRAWCARLPLIARLYEDAKIIVCVREPQWILDSFELQYRRNPLLYSRVYSGDEISTVYTRADALFKPTAVIGFAWAATAEAIMGEQHNRLLIVEYEQLSRMPVQTMARIYQFLELDFFQHDFKHVEFKSPAGRRLDDWLGTPGLHEVRPKVEHFTRATILPPDLFAKYSWPCYWRK